MSMSIVDVPLFKDLCANQMRIENDSEKNCELILNFLKGKGIMTRSDCNKYIDDIKEYLSAGLEQVDKDIIKEAQSIIDLNIRNTTAEQKLIIRRKNNILVKVNRRYDKLLNRLYGTPLLLPPPPIVYEDLNEIVESLLVPNDVVIVKVKRKAEQQPIMTINFKHKDHIHTIFINNKAGLIYKYVRLLLNKRHEEYCLLNNTVSSIFTTVLNYFIDDPKLVQETYRNFIDQCCFQDNVYGLRFVKYLICCTDEYAVDGWSMTNDEIEEKYIELEICQDMKVRLELNEIDFMPEPTFYKDCVSYEEFYNNTKYFIYDDV